jgi:hypothetical protein
VASNNPTGEDSMNLEQVQIALFDAFDMRDALASSVKRQKMDNGETIGEALDNLIQFLESLEEEVTA